MGRHANDQNKYAVASWVIALAIIFVVALLAAAAWAFTNRSSGDGGADNLAANQTSELGSAEPSAQDDTASKSEAPPIGAGDAASKDKEGADDSKSISPAATLILLDTSAQMTESYPKVSQALSQTALDLGKEDQSVAVWNYSSPLHEGVSVGYRDNLGFGPAEPAAESLTLLGTGGVPQTRSAVIAALDSAAGQAEATGETTRVLLVTTGTADDISDETFSTALEEAGENVELSVVHIGEDDPDAVLAKYADFQEVVKPTQNRAYEDVFHDAAGLA